MATGYTQTSDIGNVIPTILGPAREYMEKPTFLEKMVTHFQLKDGDGSTLNSPKWTSVLSAQSLSEGVPINNPQKLVAAAQQFTTYEVGLEVIITKKAERQTPEALRARAGKFAGNAMKRKRELDIIGLFSGFSRAIGAGAGQPFAPNIIAAASARLGAASESGQDEIAPGPYNAVLHNFHYHDVLTSAGTLGSNINSSSGYMPIDGLTEQLIREYDIKSLYGVRMAKHPQLPLVVNGGGWDATGAIFSKDALCYITTSDMMSAEWEYDMHLRAWDLVMTTEYGVGEIEDEWGFKFVADATPPTS